MMEKILSVQDFFIDGVFVILDIIVIVYFEPTELGYLGLICTLLIMASGVARPISWLLRSYYEILRPARFKINRCCSCSRYLADTFQIFCETVVSVLVLNTVCILSLLSMIKIILDIDTSTVIKVLILFYTVFVVITIGHISWFYSWIILHQSKHDLATFRETYLKKLGFHIVYCDLPLATFGLLIYVRMLSEKNINENLNSDSKDVQVTKSIMFIIPFVTYIVAFYGAMPMIVDHILIMLDAEQHSQLTAKSDALKNHIQFKKDNDPNLSNSPTPTPDDSARTGYSDNININRARGINMINGVNAMYDDDDNNNDDADIIHNLQNYGRDQSYISNHHYIHDSDNKDDYDIEEYENVIADGSTLIPRQRERVKSVSSVNNLKQEVEQEHKDENEINDESLVKDSTVLGQVELTELTVPEQHRYQY